MKLDNTNIHKGIHDAILINGLVNTSKTLLKRVHRCEITAEEFIKYMRLLFDEYEDMKYDS